MTQKEEIERALADLRRREMKETVKLAIKEWLDEQAVKFGTYSFRFLLALALSLMLYGAMVKAGWVPPPVAPTVRGETP